MVFHIIFLIFLLLPICSTSTPTSWIKAGYYYTGSEIPLSEINSQLFTHLMCGYVFVNSSTYHLSINPQDVQHLSTFTDVVKRRNPSVTTLLSIWVGREQSPIFFSMLNQSSCRKSFIESSISTAMLYGFSGIDLCGVELSTSTSMADMSNLETLLNEWRATVKDSVAATSGSTTSGQSGWLLTMMGDYMPVLGSLVYPIDAMRRNLDWVRLKSFDYYVPTKANFTYPHAALYDPSKNYQINTDAGVKEWISRGIPASKLVMGLPYHGYGWKLVNSNENGTGAPSSGPAVTLDGSIAYKVIKTLLSSMGVTSVYNATYVVNYCMIGPNWVNFDDVEAIRTKVSYAKKVGLLGYHVFQVGNDYNWVLSRAAQDEGEDPKNKKWLLAIVLVATFMFIIILGAIICYLQPGVFKSRGIIKIMESSLYKLKIMPSAGRLDSKASNLQVFSYATIKIATKNFSSENKLGEGGFGPVYKGRFGKGQEIAVKRLSKTSNQGLEEFKNEVTLTANLQHVNLARVLGYCTQREEMMLIYEYMPNSSLNLYLFDPSRRHLLDWRKRVHIIEGITQGLLYLQEYSNYTIIHRDLKASNILLDKQMNPKISDFGLARAFRKDEHEANTDRLVGTYGYVPPEYVRKGIYSMKYDVYSFGVLLLQIISGKRNTCLYGFCQNLNLLEYGYELWKEGQGMKFVDSTLDDSSSSCKLLRCMQVALLCVQENPVDRPTMLEVSSMIKNENVAIISPKKPAFSVQNYEDHKEFQSKNKEEMCSINDDSVSQVEPR